ncbi:hypothetical protein NPIL_42171 [Nephila pilipes]|uniref:Uncharacterized protein n=1 Tax=Nephila pilipes TaxID=299642 RepID=A0A8X6PF02_NEPPI|nr:hypothetical protein NPIL_42171 [Nephila pilipes]
MVRINKGPQNRLTQMHPILSHEQPFWNSYTFKIFKLARELINFFFHSFGRGQLKFSFVNHRFCYIIWIIIVAGDNKPIGSNSVANWERMIRSVNSFSHSEETLNLKWSSLECHKSPNTFAQYFVRISKLTGSMVVEKFSRRAVELNRHLRK